MLFGFKVERCIEPKGFGRPIHAQLNDFSDAGGAGYRAVMMSKARVTPLKMITIPDLELTAAVLTICICLTLKTKLRTSVSMHLW